jgi:two-component system response regulator HydG
MQLSTEGHNPPNGRTSLKQLLEAYERQLIEMALAASSGNQRRAAASLGLLPTTLHEKMKRLGLLRRRDSAALPAVAVDFPQTA